jgi:hypothetical protein
VDDFEIRGVLESMMDLVGDGDPVLDIIGLIVLIVVGDTEGLDECVDVFIGDGEPEVEPVEDVDGKMEVEAVSQADNEGDIVIDDVTHDEYIPVVETVPDVVKLFTAVVDAAPVYVYDVDGDGDDEPVAHVDTVPVEEVVGRPEMVMKPESVTESVDV